MSQIKSETKWVESNQKQVSRIKSETATSAELSMPMMALASSIWCNDGRALDAAVQFRLHLRLRLRLRLCLNLHLCLRLRRTIFLGDYEECTDEKTIIVQESFGGELSSDVSS